MNYIKCSPKTYHDYDLESAQFQSVVGKAKEMWANACKAAFPRFGDCGSCVCGAGISIDFIAPRCTVAKPKIIITAASVSPAQGCGAFEPYAQPVLDYLRANGIDAHYEYGKMD